MNDYCVRCGSDEVYLEYDSRGNYTGWLFCRSCGRSFKDLGSDTFE